MIAQAIHKRGTRASAPMLAVSCAAMPATLVEDVIFGHERGAFEGALEAHAGLFERAHGGTLFLDEVGELSREAQAALLRVLETKTLRRLGGTDEITVDVRVLAATNRDLRAMVDEGTFRADLFFRISPITVRVPPLRERDGDVDPLADRFLREASIASGAHVRGLEDEARAALHAHAWPGNVRELRNAIEQALVACTAERIRVLDLPPDVTGVRSEARAPGEAEDAAAEEGAIDLRARLRAYERSLIEEAISRAGGDRSAAAKLLGMPVRTLEKKLASLGAA